MMPNYKGDKSIMMVACYKGSKLMRISLIRMKIKFVCF